MLNPEEKIRFINLFSKFTKVPKREVAMFLENNDMSNLLKRPQTMTLDHKQLEKIAEINELRQLMYVGLQEVKGVITGPESVYNNLIKYADLTDKEYFLAMFLNTKNHIIKTEVMSVGTINASLIDIKGIGKKAIMCDAANVIISHNHPSGDPKPSNDDLLITKRIYSALKIVDIELLDHIILGEGQYLSMKEKGCFDNMPSVSSLIADGSNTPYLLQKNDEKSLRLNENIDEKQSITFYVAECMEFTNYGEYHENLSLDQAIKLFEAIPDERLNAGKGIGFTLHNHEETRLGFKTTSLGLYMNGKIDLELLNMMPEFKSNPVVQQAVWDIAKHFSGDKVLDDEKGLNLGNEDFDTPEKLAVDLDTFAYYNDSYGYIDTSVDRIAEIKQIAVDIHEGKMERLKEYLNDIIDEGEPIKEVESAKVLMNRLENLEQTLAEGEKGKGVDENYEKEEQKKSVSVKKKSIKDKLVLNKEKCLINSGGSKDDNGIGKTKANSIE